MQKDSLESVTQWVYFLTHAVYFALILFLILQTVSYRDIPWMGTWTKLPLGWGLPNSHILLTETLACFWIATELAVMLKGRNGCRGQGQSWSWEQESGLASSLYGHLEAALQDVLFAFPSQSALMKTSCWFTAKTKTQFSLARHTPVDHKGLLSYLNHVSKEIDSLFHLLLDPKNTLHSNTKKISSLTHTLSKPLTPKTGKIEFFVLIIHW